MGSVCKRKLKKNHKTCKQGFGEQEAESRTEKPTQVLQGVEHLLGWDLGSPDSAADDTPIIRAAFASRHGTRQ